MVSSHSPPFPSPFLTQMYNPYQSRIHGSIAGRSTSVAHFLKKGKQKKILHSVFQISIALVHFNLFLFLYTTLLLGFGFFFSFFFIKDFLSRNDPPTSSEGKPKRLISLRGMDYRWPLVFHRYTNSKAPQTCPN